MKKLLLSVTAGLLCFGVTATSAVAAEFELRYEGVLSGAESLIGPDGVDLVVAETPFSFSARFDTSSPNLVAPIPVPGFVAYAPSAATITILGTDYDVTRFDQDPDYGIGIAIFDPSNVFFPGVYGIGFIANPIEDGAGIVADFRSASPDFSVLDLMPTVFGDFDGAGYLAGIGCAPPDPRPCAARPLALTGPSGEAWFLGFQNGDRPGGVTHRAELLAVPEPTSIALLSGSVAVIAGAFRRRRTA